MRRAVSALGLSALLISCGISFVSPVRDQALQDCDADDTCEEVPTPASDTDVIVDGLSTEAMEHRAFITSTGYQGDLTTQTGESTGIEAADAICAGRSSAANLSLTYKAIISVAGTAASNNLTLSGSVYVFSSSETRFKIAENGTDLWSANTTELLNELNYDESYNSTSGQVWTGTDTDGTEGLAHCNSWTSKSGSASGYKGNNGGTDGTFLYTGGMSVPTCNTTGMIYCISQW